MEFIKFAKSNFIIIALSILLANIVALYWFYDRKTQYEAKIPFSVAASTDAINLTCDGNKACWNELFFNSIKATFPNSALINGVSPVISMSSYDTGSFDKLRKALQTAADAANADLLREAQANLKEYDEDYPKEVLNTDYLAQRYVRTKTILKIYSEGAHPPVTVGNTTVSTKPHNLSVWISSATIIGGLLGSAIAFSVRRIHTREKG